MKNLLLVLIIPLLCWNCSSDADQTSAAILGSANGNSFKIRPGQAYVAADNSLMIIGRTGNRKLVLQTYSAEVGTYLIGTSPKTQAAFTSEEDSLFLATSKLGIGSINITENSGHSISGTFSFRSYSKYGGELTLNKGRFFNLALKKGTPSPAAENGSFTAKIDGFFFNAPVLAAKVDSDELMIVGQDSRTSILFSLPKEAKAGQYELTAKGLYSVDYLYNGVIEYGTGKITVVSHDTAKRFIEIKFSFTTNKNNTEVTEGTLRFSY